MNEVFIRSLYKTIVQEGKKEYKELLDNTNIEDVTDKYWERSLKLYNSLSEENKEIMTNIIQQTMIDTISNMLGIIDGSSTLSGCDAELKLYLDNINTDSELQDLFLEYVEEIEE